MEIIRKREFEYWFKILVLLRDEYRFEFRFYLILEFVGCIGVGFYINCFLIF